MISLSFCFPHIPFDVECRSSSRFLDFSFSLPISPLNSMSFFFLFSNHPSALPFALLSNSSTNLVPTPRQPVMEVVSSFSFFFALPTGRGKSFLQVIPFSLMANFFPAYTGLKAITLLAKGPVVYPPLLPLNPLFHILLFFFFVVHFVGSFLTLISLRLSGPSPYEPFMIRSQTHFRKEQSCFESRGYLLYFTCGNGVLDGRPRRFTFDR